MSIESANPADAGSGTYADSLSMDDAVNLLSDEEAEADEAKPLEDDAADLEQEQEEAEGEQPEGEGADDEPQEEAEAEAVVTLGDGAQLTVKELKDGYFRDKDYRVKTSELANSRRDLEAKAQRVQGTIDAFVDHLAKHLPDEPDISLAQTNPGEFVQRKALYDSAVSQLQHILNLADAPKQIGQQVNDQQRSELLASENAKLLERLPVLKDEAMRQDFNRKISETAQSFGFTAEELSQNLDHRFYVLGHYARLGMEAEQAKAKAATKVKAAPPIAPAAKRSVSQSEAATRKNREAMARLAKTGSLKDALLIDFD